MAPDTRLLILARGEITRDPRAWRSLTAAARRGMTVSAICVSDSPAAREMGAVKIDRLNPGALTTAYRRGSVRSRPADRRPARELRGLFRLVRMLRTCARMYRAGRQARADIVHAHDLDTLPAGWLLARKHHARLVYDAHELYADQDPQASWIERRGAVALEKRLGRRADAVVTVGDGIARELESRLELTREVLVVLNAPAVAKGIPTTTRGEQRLLAVYQGAMGPGRHVDDLLNAAASTDGVHLTLRLAGTDIEELGAEVARRDLSPRVDVVPPVSPDALVPALAGFDVGLIINRPVTRNDELVCPNKLFEYMMAGLAVVAPRLPELSLLLEREGVGLTYEPGNPRDLARALEELAADRPRLLEMKHRARDAALTRYNAEAQEPVLLQAWGL